MPNFLTQIASLCLLATVCPGLALSDTGSPYSYSAYGTPGLLDMPTAQSAEDAELAATISHFGGSTRTTLSFQVTPRLSASFRYSRIANWTNKGDTFDRSFDLRYRLMDEGKWRPALAVGLQDFIGTGIYSGEYVVATKHITPRLAVTGGLGWGRLGSYDGFTNPLGALDERFKTRSHVRDNLGGQLESANWFRGNASVFGGVSWAATDRLTLKAEYSSDAYSAETTPARDLFKHKSPFNFGASYKLRKGLHFQAYAMHGSEVGFSFTTLTNPRHPTVYGGRHSAPVPVAVRPATSVQELGWANSEEVTTTVRQKTADALAADGMELEAMRLDARSVTIHLRTNRFAGSPEAIGRSARILTQAMPGSVETFTIVPMANGLPTAAVTIARSDMEAHEFDINNIQESYAQAQISDANGTLDGSLYSEGVYPRFRWSLGPYAASSLFDPDSPVRLDFGAKLSARFDVAPGLTLSGNLQHRLAGNRDESTRSDPSKQHRVRSDANIYAKADTTLTHLTMSYNFRPGKNLYGRVTAGYLERMYGGLSAELLWKPVDSRLGLGLEVNQVKQRDFEGLGFKDYQTTTGHLSAYYDFGKGYHGQIDAGRYLAGDWGTTISLDRTFANGWKIGAYSTFTDVSFDDFGEGSFDKGIRVTIPFEHVAARLQTPNIAC